MNQEEQPFVSLHLTPARSQGHGSWLRYFAAALCLGVAQGQEQVLLDYWWVYNDSPSPVADAVQILRVTGEKGEKYEEVLQPSDYKLMADSARSLIGRSMRGEVVALASQYISEGMSSSAAYEKAWTKVYRRRVKSGESSPESARMQDLLQRVTSAETLDGFTPGELLLALHALLADEKRMETEEGRQLLEKIANRLRSMGYTKDLQALCANDEVMALFIDALQHDMNAFAAYRDALFKVNRDMIVRHSLVGYCAPWGAGMGSRIRYHQSPKRVVVTTASGNTQPLVKPSAPAQTEPSTSPNTPPSLTSKDESQPVESNGENDSENRFLATSPASSAEKKDSEQRDNDAKGASASEDVAPVPMFAAAPMMRSASPAALMSALDEGGGESDITASVGTGGVLRWNSTTGVWDTEQTTAWLDENGTSLPYTAGSQVEFGNLPGVSKSVQIAAGGVEAGAVVITGTGYQFSGDDMVVTNRLSTTADASFASTLVIGSSSTPLYIDVTDSSTLTLANLSTHSTQTNGYTVFESGSLTKTGKGTLLITNSVQGSIADVKVQGGVFQLGSGVTLDVGANRITGGTLENVELQLTGDIWRPVSQNTVTVHNLISSADEVNAAVLTGVQLNAGTATEYATLYNVVFAGESTLTGHITIEKTQAQREIGVAAGGILTINQATFDLRGMASGLKVLIVNGALDDTTVAFALPDNMSGLTGTLEGWDTVNFVYSGIEVNEKALITSVAGVVSIEKDHSGNLYWNGAADDKWNPGSSNWSSKADLSGQEAFSALSNVYFVAENTEGRAITVTQDMVVMNLGVTDGGYSFDGARVAVLGDASLAFDSGEVEFKNHLVVQGNLQSAGDGSLKLSSSANVAGNAVFNNLTTTIGGDLTVVGTLAVNANTLEISGNVSAAQMSITVNSDKSTISGNLTSTGLMSSDGTVDYSKALITIGGTAEQHYTGVVKTHDLTVNAGQNDVYFSHLHVERLTVGENTHVHVLTESDSVAVSSSEFHDIYLSGTLSLDSYGTTYNNGYNVLVQNDKAQLHFGEGTTIDKMTIDGSEKNHHDLVMTAESSNATITSMKNLGNLLVESGSVTVNDASGAVHGNLTLYKANLSLGADSDQFLASDTGEIKLLNGASLNLGSTTQSLSAENHISLAAGSSIYSKDAEGRLQFANGAQITYSGEDNTLNVGMELAANSLTISAGEGGAGHSLEISSPLSGTGQVTLSGAGTVAFSGDNSAFTGLLYVGDKSTLALQSALTLQNAGVELETGGKLALEVEGTEALRSLTLHDGAILSITSINGTKAVSAKDAVLDVGSEKGKGVSFAGEKILTLNVHFSDPLKTMTYYNLMTGVESIDNLSFSVLHGDKALDASQYKIGLDAETGLLYMYTMMGNVWDGEGAGYGTRYWSTTNTDGNWSSGNGNYDESGEYKAAIFGDLNGGSGKVEVPGEVSPGDVYFVANNTVYELSGYGSLAQGTNLHKDGDANVIWQLFGNRGIVNADNEWRVEGALGNVDILDGSLILENSLAVSGTMSIESDGKLVITKNEPTWGDSVFLTMVNEWGYTAYTASVVASGSSATLSDVTVDVAGIRGTNDARGSVDQLMVWGNADLSFLTLTDFEANGNVSLSHVTLKSSNTALSHDLANVTIGQGVEVDASGFYTLSGTIVFENTLLNKGTVTLDDINAEIGKINYDTIVDADSGKVGYVYQIIKSEGAGSLAEHTLDLDQISINGVKLTTGENGNLADGIVVDFAYDGNGSITLSIGDSVTDENGKMSSDGSVGMPQWDERWGKSQSAPGLSRRYTGTDASANIELAAGKDGNTNYFHYDSIVKGNTAAQVNGGNAIVVTLSSVARGELAAGGQIKWGGSYAAGHEVWIYDSSGIKNIVGGLASWAEPLQTAATHVLVDAPVPEDAPSPEDGDRTTWNKLFVIAGSRWCTQGTYWDNQAAESYVTVKDGQIYTVFGGSVAGTYNSIKWEWCATADQYGTSHVFIDGGRIGEIFAGGCWSSLYGTQVVNGRKRAVEMVITGGEIGGTELRVFGGGERGYVEGDIYIRMEGDAYIRSRLVGGSNAGIVNGNIELDLISGSAFRVDAAGLGWRHAYDNGYVEEEKAQIYGDVLVNLYSNFTLGEGADGDLRSGIYGGMETTNYVVITKPDAKSTLHFAEGEEYELGFVDAKSYKATEKSIIVTGFDRFLLEEGAHVVLALGMFDIDMDPLKTLIVSGKGVLEVVGHGSNFGRNILLEDEATLKISTCDIGDAGKEDDRTITVTGASTIDFSGFPIEMLYEDVSDDAGLGFNVVISGDGVNGKGAIYKGSYDDTRYPKNVGTSETGDPILAIVDKIVLPEVKLSGSASIRVDEQEALFMNAPEQGVTQLDLAGHTLTKLGAGEFITRSASVSAGTILVQQGTFGFDLTGSAAQTDIVLAAGTELQLASSYLGSSDTTTLELRSLSGSGTVNLNGSTLTLNTNGATYYDVYMDETQSYDQLSGKTGFGYAVFSGLIRDAGTLVKTGSGVQYISGSSNSYTGGTLLQEGVLYLLGTGEPLEFDKETSKVASGVAGTGSIKWDSSDAELYLGHGAHIYNHGTTNVQGGAMTIGVEGALNGVLADFIGTYSRPENESGEIKYVTMGGEDYVEIDTHNLKSIPVAGMYADGTTYEANADIDRNKMLLVKESDWITAKTSSVTCLSATGYNEAVYSGVLRDGESGDETLKSCLHKVGDGTLVLDQVNTYSGGTEVVDGTLRLRGWGTMGSGDVEVTDGASLMLAYTRGYGDETTELDNNITLSGSGDTQWLSNEVTDDGPHALTDGKSAALISAVGLATTVVLNGDITDAEGEAAGGVLHSGDGTLVLRGNSSYTGGTLITRGVVEVQSASGLGSTKDGQSAVVLEKNAELRVTVMPDYDDIARPDDADNRLVTTLASVDDDIQGKVHVEGTALTERVLHIEGNGYMASSTALEDNGTFLLSGLPVGDDDEAGIKSQSGVLSGSGAVVVSDAAASGAKALFDFIEDYTGDFRVEGDNASIQVKTGTFTGGSIEVEGRHASVQIGSNVSIEAGQELYLRSTGTVPASSGGHDVAASYGTGAALISGGSVSVAAGALLSVSKGETSYDYDIKKLATEVTLTPENAILAGASKVGMYHAVGAVPVEYQGQFAPAVAINQQAAGAVNTSGGLTLTGGSTYEADSAHISLMGGSLTLDTMENNLITLRVTLDNQQNALSSGEQLVLFSDVSSMTFGYDNDTEFTAQKGTGVHYTRADRYFTGSDYISSETVLVYDSEAGVVYLQTVPILVPEPATATLSLLALAALCARRRRK